MQHIFTEMGKEDGKGGETLGGGADDTERRGGNRGRAKKLLHILHFELAYPIIVDRFASVFGLNSICILSSTAGDHSNSDTSEQFTFYNPAVQATADHPSVGFHSIQ